MTTKEETLVSVEELLVENKDLMLYNDDVNTFEHVIESLVEICDHHPIQAEQCAWIIHNNGKCQVRRGEWEVLEPMCTALLERGLSATIE